MSLFRTRSGPVATPQFTGLQLQTASSALPIPIVYGTSRLAPNLIWSANFQTHPQYTQSGGKGGGGKTNLSGYTYSTALIFALGEGPIVALGAVYKGQGLHKASDFFFSLFTGTTPQVPWGYLAASVPKAALAYQGTAYAATSYFDLGSSASIASIAFEVQGRLAPSAAGAHDADPAAVVADFLTNPQYGVGFPAANLDATSLLGQSGDGSYQTYCRACGLVFSPCLTDQETASETLARWLQITNSTAVWSGGRLKILPLGDGTVTGAPPGGATTTFQPNTTPAMDLGDDDFVGDAADDPLLVTRADPYAASNLQRLEILDRTNQYSATPVEARDQNAIELYGLCIGSTITAHEICDLGVGATAAQLILQRGLYIRNTYAFRLSWDYCLLEPMDIVTLTDPGLGLARTPVRITAVEEDQTGLLQVTAEEFPGAVATAPAYPVAGAVGGGIDRNVVPAPINPPVILEPPSDLTDGAAQIWIGLSGGTNGIADPNWGGAVLYVSTDNATYTQIGTVSAPARQGVVTAALVAPAAAGLSDTLAVSLAESGGVVAPFGNSPLLCVVDGEIISFTSAALTGANAYALGGLQRRLYGLRGSAHAAGASFLVLDAGVFHYIVPDALIGQPLYLKAASYNVFGAAAQDLSTCVAYTVTPVGSGLFGPVAQEIALGASMDDGLASGGVGEIDSFGLASDPYTDTLDMGLASDGASSLAVAAGGTGATSAPAARQNIGAAAAGANADITSLTGVAGIGINTSADTTGNRLAVKSASVLFDNIGNGVQVTVDKAGSGDTATVLYQTNYSGRASAGLIGGDRYRIVVSPNGAGFTQALDIDPATGHIGLAGYSADASNALGVAGTSILFAAATDSCRFAVNKVAAGNDASLTFQTGFSARALAGLLGSDGYQLKVSPDGSSFYQVYVADQASGNLAMKALLSMASYSVAGLPAGFSSALAFASNGRKVGEAAGSGSGVLVAFSNGAWRRLSDDATVVA